MLLLVWGVGTKREKWVEAAPNLLFCVCVFFDDDDDDDDFFFALSRWWVVLLGGIID